MTERYLTAAFKRANPPGTRIRHPLYGAARIDQVYRDCVIVEWESALARIEQTNRIEAGEIPYMSRIGKPPRRLTFEDLNTGQNFSSVPELPDPGEPALQGSPPDGFMDPSGSDEDVEPSDSGSGSSGGSDLAMEGLSTGSGALSPSDQPVGGEVDPGTDGGNDGDDRHFGSESEMMTAKAIGTPGNRIESVNTKTLNFKEAFKV